jgi:hypothetical protein
MTGVYNIAIMRHRTRAWMALPAALVGFDAYIRPTFG